MTVFTIIAYHQNNNISLVRTERDKTIHSAENTPHTHIQASSVSGLSQIFFTVGRRTRISTMIVGMTAFMAPYLYTIAIHTRASEMQR
jgi:hypothetical protein